MSQQKLTAGDLAPDFELPSASGGVVHLYDQLTRSSVVLFFYVRNFTPVCMAEVCSFRDSVEDFSHFGAQLFGISPGSESITKRFAKYHNLPFPLLLDVENHVRNLYHVPKLFGILPGRSTFVIGQNRTVLKAIHAGFESKPHIVESLNILRSKSGA